MPVQHELVGGRFAPLLVLSKYPYHFVPKPLIEPVAHALFDRGQFWQRQWSIYYAVDLKGEQCMTFVPENEFLQLMHEIHDAFPSQDVKGVEQYGDESLLILFPDPSCFHARYLGTSSSKEDFGNLFTEIKMDMPFTYTNPGETEIKRPDDIDEEMYEVFWEELNLALKPKRLNKSKRELEKVKKREAFLQESDGHLIRGQRYVGLRPSQKGLPEQSDGTAHGLYRIDPSHSVPLPFHEDAVIIAIDIEASEVNHDIITEAGIAVLDTRDIRNLPPGVGPLGCEWFTRIKGRHLRIAENLAVRNEFVGGDPSRFDFGKSEVVPNASLCKSLAATFEITDTESVGGGFRKTVLVGHAVAADLSFLSRIGFTPAETSGFVDTVDTQRMWHSLHGTPNDRNVSLKRVLSGTKIPYCESSLHNAGNDAVYTMMGYLGLAVWEASIRREAKAMTLEGASEKNRSS